jgi:ribonuclease E
MTKRMLIDASHPEETRVVVLDGNRLEAFDIESANRKPLKGNIYLARVVRVEPSLQAAFVEYGGNRHGFLAFGEIHPDYYQLPVADRQRLIEMQQAEAREEREREEAEDAARAGDHSLQAALDQAAAARAAEPDGEPDAPPADVAALEAEAAEATVPHEGVAVPEDGSGADAAAEAAEDARDAEDARVAREAEAADAAAQDAADHGGDHGGDNGADVESVGNADAPPPETVGGSTEDEARERRIPPRFMRHYKIQEVIKRRQIMLIQVVKEERGTKGAALTTYISLAGRFSVLMPNSPRGGGVSRKITSAADRKRLRDIIDEQQLPDGMSLIVRTAGAARPKPEIKKDCEYLLRLWDGIRERTFASTAPALIYEEADLIKRSVRDVYGKDVEEVVVDGEDAFQEAREFMRMLMPAHANKVRPVRDGVPLFARYGVDAQLDAMHSPNVQLKSGGYIVINQTEALVAIDVNSGRATRDRHIEDTALRTNLEAADEIARQLRLRDLAGLIVIDFIDMESSKHDGMVERRLKEALKQDRARIQVGRISHFGLLEMSRQRLRPSVVEHAYVTCAHCQGRGIVRSVESSGLQVLRAIEEEGAKRRAAEIVVHVASPIAFWMLNRKRERLAQIEEKFGMAVLLSADDTLAPPALRIERTRAANPDALPDRPAALRMDYAPEPEETEAEPEVMEAEGAEEARPAAAAEREARDGTDAEGKRRRRRRRRGRRDGTEARGPEGAPGADEEGEAEEGDAAEPAETAGPEAAGTAEDGAPDAAESAEDESARRRRRGRRGGRRRREEGEAEAPAIAAEAPTAPPPQAAPAPQRRAPTPADPFAGHLDDIMLAMEAAEVAAEAEATRRSAAPPVIEAAPPPVATEAPPAPPAPMAAPVVAEAEPAPTPAPEPVPEPAPAPVAEAAPPAAAEPVAAPPIAPIVLGEGAATELPRKRGWWRA